MLLRLPEEIDSAIQAQGSPLCVTGARGEDEYMILSKDQFDRYRAIFDQGPFTPEEKRFMLQEMGRRAGWDDPEMDVYDNYDLHRQQMS